MARGKIIKKLASKIAEKKATKGVQISQKEMDDLMKIALGGPKGGVGKDALKHQQTLEKKMKALHKKYTKSNRKAKKGFGSEIK